MIPLDELRADGGVCSIRALRDPASGFDRLRDFPLIAAERVGFDSFGQPIRDRWPAIDRRSTLRAEAVPRANDCFEMEEDFFVEIRSSGLNAAARIRHDSGRCTWKRLVIRGPASRRPP